MTEKQEIKIETKKNTSFNHVWWIPLIALLMGLYLLITYYTSKGSLIQISFSDAEGISVEKTVVKYKDVEIGRVEKIKLSEDNNGVIVFARMDKDYESLLREQTRFWVVKPRVEITKITGLQTILSGSYITIDPALDGEYRYDFKGLEEPPIITQGKSGLRLTLLADKASSIGRGTSVYYKGIVVGEVDRKYLSEDLLWVKVDIFIYSPYDKLIKQNTLFWSTSGITVNPDATGLNVELDSVESLIAGGIAFRTANTDMKYPVISGSEFILFNNKKQTEELYHGKKYQFVSYFDGSIKGLNIGADITIRGISIGKVKDIKLIFDHEKHKTIVPVIFEIYDERLSVSSLADNADKTIFKDATQLLIEKGLRARLETASLITGAKFISLVMVNDDSKKHPISELIDPVTGLAIIPSSSDSFNTITNGVADIITKVNKMPLDLMMSNINKLIVEADEVINGVDLKSTLKEVNSLIKEGKLMLKDSGLVLKQGKSLSKDAATTLKTINKEIKELSKSANEALSGLSPDAPLYHNLNKTLDDLNETLESFKSVSDMLDRTPDALIFGEDRQGFDDK